jgi:hypothetical protein
MNFQFYIEKLFDSKEFQDFKKENPSAFLCSGFFSIDKKPTSKNPQGDNQQHLDYFIPELNKMFSFKLNQNPVELMPVDNFAQNSEDQKPEFKKISDNLDFEFEEFEKMIEQKMQEEKINKNIEKLLWSLQHKDGKEYLIGTIFISNLGMIKASIDLQEKQLKDFEKKSFMDFLKITKKPKKSEDNSEAQ